MTHAVLRLKVNGRRVELEDVPDAERLLDTLRWRLHLKGTKEGCRSGACGACTILVDERTTLACLALTHELDGTAILTVEGISRDPVGRVVQDAFVSEGAVQCGYCTPGFVMALTGRLKEPRAGEDDAPVLRDLEGNLCRCTGYAAIARAVRRARSEVG
ncbi:MAG: (2Fe-2S)-binding protein [Thermoplasmata archaeon]